MYRPWGCVEIYACTQRPQTYTQLVVPPGTLLSHYLAIMLRRKSRNDVRLTRTSHIVDIVVDVTVNDAKCRGGKEVVAHTKHKKNTKNDGKFVHELCDYCSATNFVTVPLRCF